MGDVSSALSPCPRCKRLFDTIYSMTKIKYISRRDDKNLKPWIRFGAPNKNEYEKWNPQVCGICCLKMIGDTHGLTTNASLYQLTMACKQKGGFKELPGGEIQGVFYKPLLELARNYGLEGKIEKRLTMEEIIGSIKGGKLVVLSIAKSKVNPSLKGGHLILVHAYDPKAETFLVHDPEPILAKDGQNIKVGTERLEEISNKRGLVIWQRRDLAHFKSLTSPFRFYF